MKEASSDPPSGTPATTGESTRQSPSAPPMSKSGNETQVIDLADVEVLVAQHAAESARQLEAEAEAEAARSERSMPPPLPPPLPAEELARASLTSVAAPVAAPGRSTTFYVVALLAFLVLGVGGGLVVAMTMRGKEPAATPAGTSAPASAAGGAANPTRAPEVITIPTVEMQDDTADGGK